MSDVKSRDIDEHKTKIVAFRLPTKIANALSKKAKADESQSDLMRRVVDTFLSLKNK